MNFNRVGHRVWFFRKHSLGTNHWAFLNYRSNGGLCRGYQGPLAPAGQCNLLFDLLDMLTRP